MKMTPELREKLRTFPGATAEDDTLAIVGDTLKGWGVRPTPLAVEHIAGLLEAIRFHMNLVKAPRRDRQLGMNAMEVAIASMGSYIEELETAAGVAKVDPAHVQ